MLAFKLAIALLQLVLDVLNGLAHALCRSHVVAGRINGNALALHQNFTGQRMNAVNLFDLIAKKLNSGGFLVVDGDDLNGVALDPEVASDKLHVVALVLNRNQ